MSLSEAMLEEPNEAEVTVLRTFVVNLMSLQNRLDESYHTDQFLRDLILTDVNIPSIQSALRDRLPTTIQEAANRIANQFSEKKKSAGSNLVCLARDYEAMYSLGKTYGGDERRNTKTPWANIRGRHTQKDTPRRRLSPEWMEGVKGGFVCGEDHRESSRHKKEEVTAAINKLKSNYPTAWLTIDDLSNFMDMVTDDREDEKEPKEEEVRWVEDDYDDAQTDILFMTITDAEDIERKLSENNLIHGRSFKSDMNIALNVMNRRLKDPDGEKFNGITIDTAANRKSVMFQSQYQANEQEFGRNINIRQPRRGLKGLGGRSKVIGEVTIKIPFINLELVMYIGFAIIEKDALSLLSNTDLIDNGLDISLQGGYLHIGTRKKQLTLENNLFVYRWTSDSIPYSLYSEHELRNIHRRFKYPSLNATHNLLKRANEDNLEADVKKMLDKITEHYKICKANDSAPRRIKLTIGTDDIQFNHSVIIETMFISSKHVLHLVDEGTHFTAAAFLKNHSSSDIWRSITRLWTHVYMVPPDFLSFDQGSAYISQEFKANAAAAGITIEEAPIETPGEIGIVERYHAPLRAAYTKLRQDMGKYEATDSECLKMALYAVNSTMGPEGLCPMMLVFGAFPRPARTTPSPSQLHRQRTIEDAKRVVSTEQAKRRLAFEKRHPSSPKAKELSQKLMDLSSGSPVLMYRTKTKTWDGPYRYMNINVETVVVQLNKGRKIFRSTPVKPWVHSRLQPTSSFSHNTNITPTPADHETEEARITTDTSTDEIDLGNIARKIPVKKGSKE